MGINSIADMAPSDWLMLLFAVGALWFVLDYGIFSPWWRSPIGIVVFTYGVSVVLLMVLIVYGMFRGDRVDEWARVMVAGALVLGIFGKIIVLHVARREGRIERRKERTLQSASTVREEA